jgi:mannose-6-phosphate isomerase-like protein (cupin superfamily)
MTTRFQTTVLLRSEQTDDRLGVVENTVPARWDGPPLHHHDFDETFYVLDGELTFQVGDARVTAGPGQVAFAPRAVPHTLANLGEQPARYVVVCTPGGFERYFDRIAAENAGVEPPATARKPYPETTVVGPPIGGRD